MLKGVLLSHKWRIRLVLSWMAGEHMSQPAVSTELRWRLMTSVLVEEAPDPPGLLPTDGESCTCLYLGPAEKRMQLQAGLRLIYEMLTRPHLPGARSPKARTRGLFPASECWSRSHNGKARSPKAISVFRTSLREFDERGVSGMEGMD